jgi:hypothetical protein
VTARGDRINNPLNLRHSGQKWQGATEAQIDDEFVSFKSVEYGFRAAARNILTYGKRAWNTVTEICTHWAPPSENDTAKYITDVCDWTGFTPDEVLDLDSAEVMLPLLRAMARKEQGKTYKDAVILEGMRMAGVHDVKSKPMVKQPAVQATTIAGIGSGIAAAGEVARQVRDVQSTAQTGVDFVSWLVSYGPWLAVALVVVGSGLALYAMWRKQHRTGG